MAYDYTDDVAFAVEMVEEFGRGVQFVTLSETRDDANPLAGSTTQPTVSDPIPAVFVAIAGLNELGASAEIRDLLKAYEQTCLVAPSTTDYEACQLIRESDGGEWKIGRVLKFMPGDTALLYYIGVNR